MPRFSDAEMRIYSRQILLREVGGRGQERLRQTPVSLLCRGVTGLYAAQYLARAGVTRLTAFSDEKRTAGELSAVLREAGCEREHPFPSSNAPPLFQAAFRHPHCAAALMLDSDSQSEAKSAPQALLWAVCFGSRGLTGIGLDALQNVAAEIRADGSEEAAEEAALATGAALALRAALRILGQPDRYPNPWLLSE